MAGSSRLKNKLLLKFVTGPWCNIRLTDYFKREIVSSTMCTTTDPEDDVLANRWSNSAVACSEGVRTILSDARWPARVVLGFLISYAGADDVLLDPEFVTF